MGKIQISPLVNPVRRLALFRKSSSILSRKRPQVLWAPTLRSGPSNGVKLIMGMIYSREDVLGDAERIFSKRFGPVDFRSEPIVFDFTDYYEKEMGPGLKRRFLSFRDLIKKEELAKIKIFTDRIEKRFSIKGRRQINIDPGYISAGKLVLATVKDRQHRVYLRKGIYAEVTLRFMKGNFRPWDWTYPDYRTKTYIDIFNEIRRKYLSNQ